CTVPKEDLAIFYVRSLLHFLPAAEPEDLRSDATRKRQACRVIFVQDCEIRRQLVFEDARFRLDIGLKCAMSIEVVWCDIQDHRHLGTKSPNRFQLKTRNFKHDDRLAPCISH